MEKFDIMPIRLMILHITDILSTMVCLIVDLSAAISPNVCSPNQPLTKGAFIANLPNLTQPIPLPYPVEHVSPFPTLFILEKTGIAQKGHLDIKCGNER